LQLSIPYGSLQWTSLVSLYARYLEYLKKDSIYKDEISYQIVNQLDYDFTEIKNQIDLIKQLTIVIRHVNFEREIKNFIKSFPNTTIIDIGSGFDTLFYRVDNNKIKWFDLDYPEVLNIKKQLIPLNPRYKFIIKPLSDFTWIDDIGSNNNGVFIIIGSLLKYLEKDEIIKLFKNIGIRFPDAELIFDTGSSLLLKEWRRLNRKNNLDPSDLKFSLEGPEELNKWNLNFSILDHYSIFSHIKREAFWPEVVHKTMDLMDENKVYAIYHVKFH